MSFQGGDFGFVGSSYTPTDPAQDRQYSLNWFTEYSQDGKSKTATALLGAPGLQPILTAAQTPTAGGEVRGFWVLPGGTRAIVVCGSRVGMMTMTVPATQTSVAQFAFMGIGNIGTNNGRVAIRDNGIGGYVMISDGVLGYLLNLATLALTVIADAGFIAPTRIAFIDGWWICNVPGTNRFVTNGPTPYAITFPAAFFALKDSSSDNLITLMENNRECWLIGERASEVWYNAGGANFSFSRIPGVQPQIGCAAPQSLARAGSSLCWLARSERGENIVVRSDQYSFAQISNRAVEAAIAKYPLVSDAIGDTYEEGGHLFYVLTFPTADKTHVYDFSSEEWHERASFTSSTGAFHRIRANCFANFQNLRMVGDYTSGYIHYMSRDVFTDAGFNSTTGLATTEPLIAVRRTPILWARENRHRLAGASIQIDFRPGMGLQNGQGSTPRLMLKWSDDAGETYGNEHWLNVGAVGKFKNRAMLRRTGTAFNRVWEARYSDPTNRDIVGATWDAEVNA